MIVIASGTSWWLERYSCKAASGEKEPNWCGFGAQSYYNIGVLGKAVVTRYLCV